jgi:hypothetical protein
MRGIMKNGFTSAMAMQIAQIRSSPYKCATGAVTGTSSFDDSFKEKWGNVKESSHPLCTGSIHSRFTFAVVGRWLRKKAIPNGREPRGTRPRAARARRRAG